VLVKGTLETDLSFLKGDECCYLSKEYSMDISRHLAFLKVDVVPMGKPGSPVTKILQDLDSGSDEDMLEYKTTPPDGVSNLMVVRFTKVDAKHLKLFLTLGTQP
jgi:hypothetical protein